MDSTYHRFREIMKMVEQNPNDFDLGKEVRNYYWTEWKKISDNHLTPPTSPNQLKMDFEEGIESVARLGED